MSRIALVTTGLLWCATTAFSAPVFAAVDWDNSAGSLTTIDAATGVVDVISLDLPARMNALVAAPDGALLAASHAISGVGFADIFRIDPVSRNSSLLVTIPLGGDRTVRSLGYDAGGQLLAFANFEPVVLALDLDLGIAQVVLGFPASFAQGMAISPVNGKLFGIGPSGVGQYSLSTLNLSNGNFRRIVTNAPGSFNQGLEFTPDGRLFAIGQGEFAELDPATGLPIGQVLSTPGDWRGLALIPEPTTAAGLLMCIAALGARGRR